MAAIQIALSSFGFQKKSGQSTAAAHSYRLRALWLAVNFCYTPPSVPTETPVNDFVRPPPVRGKSVKGDWRAWLPEAKAQVFEKQVHELESSYVMLSVSLDEAIELRELGYPGKSLQAVGITSGLCKLLTEMLAGLLRALS